MNSLPRVFFCLAIATTVLGSAWAATWDPFDKQTLETMNPEIISLSMMDPAISDMITKAYYCSGPEGRATFQKKFKAAILATEGEDAKQGMKNTLDNLMQLPLSRFFHFRLKGTSQEEVAQFAKANGGHLHIYNRSGLFSKTHHVLLSGPEASFPMFREQFAGRIEHEHAVERLKVEIGFKTGGNFAEIVWPTGTDWQADFGELDVWSAAGILSAFQEEKAKGLQRMVKQQLLAPFEGMKEKVSRMAFNVFLPGEDEPVFSK